MALLKNLKLVIGLSKKGLTKLNGDMRRMKSDFRRDFGEIAGIANSVATALTTGLVAGLGAVIKAGAKLQTLQVGFRSLMGGAEEAKDMVARLNEFTAATPFALEEVAHSARGLLAVGTAADDVNDRLKMLGDIAAASGNSITDISAAFAKVQAKGKVELENLNQLAERNIPIFDALREVTGDANMEFGAGSVSVEEYNQALANMAADGGFANDAMANLSETVEGKLTTAMDNVTKALGDFAEKSGLLTAITDQLDLATRTLQRYNTTDDDARASMKKSEQLLGKLEKAHKGNAEALSIEADEAKTAAEKLDKILDTEESQLALALATDVATQAWDIYLESLKQVSDIADAPVTPITKTKEAFEEQYDAAAKLAKQKEELRQLTADYIITAEEEAESMAGIASLYEKQTFSMPGMEMGMEEEVDEVDESSRLMAGMERLAMLEEVKAMVDGMTVSTLQLAAAVGDQLGNAFHSMVTGAKSAKEAFKQFAASVIKSALAASQASIIAAAIKQGMKSPMALMVIPALIAAGQGIVDAAFGQIPQMKDGGLFTGASLAMVGEGPGTSAVNPEVVAPLDKLQQMMGGGNVTVTGRLDGRDILISSERAGFDRNRVRGF